MPLYRTNAAAYMSDLLQGHGARQHAGTMQALSESNRMRLASGMRTADTIGRLAGLPLQFQQQQAQQRAAEQEAAFKMADMLGKQEERGHRMQMAERADARAQAGADREAAAARGRENFVMSMERFDGDMDQALEYARINDPDAFMAGQQMVKEVYATEAARAGVEQTALTNFMDRANRGLYDTPEKWKQARKALPSGIQDTVPTARPTDPTQWGMDIRERMDLEASEHRLTQDLAEGRASAWSAADAVLAAATSADDFAEGLKTQRLMAEGNEVATRALDAFEQSVNRRGFAAARDLARRTRLLDPANRMRSTEEVRAHAAVLAATGRPGEAETFLRAAERMTRRADEGKPPDLSDARKMVARAATDLSRLASEEAWEVGAESFNGLYGMLDFAAQDAARHDRVSVEGAEMVVPVQPIAQMAPVVMEAATRMGQSDLVIALDPDRRMWMPMSQEMRLQDFDTPPPVHPLSTELLAAILGIAQAERRHGLAAGN